MLRIGGCILKPNVVKRYPSVALWRGAGKGFKRCNIHRLMAETFFGPDVRQVNHIDADRGNNLLTNLEYMTRAENMAHMVKLGRSTKGMRNPCAKLTDAQVVDIRKATGYTHQQLGDKYGVRASTIGMIRIGRTWTHVVVQ